MLWYVIINNNGIKVYFFESFYSGKDIIFNKMIMMLLMLEDEIILVIFNIYWYINYFWKEFKLVVMINIDILCCRYVIFGYFF